MNGRAKNNHRILLEDIRCCYIAMYNKKIEISIKKLKINKIEIKVKASIKPKLSEFKERKLKIEIIWEIIFASQKVNDFSKFSKQDLKVFWIIKVQNKIFGDSKTVCFCEKIKIINWIKLKLDIILEFEILVKIDKFEIKIELNKGIENLPWVLKNIIKVGIKLIPKSNEGSDFTLCANFKFKGKIALFCWLRRIIIAIRKLVDNKVTHKSNTPV